MTTNQNQFCAIDQNQFYAIASLGADRSTPPWENVIGSYDYTETLEEGELQHLRLDDVCLTAFSKISGYAEIPFYDPAVLEASTPLEGARVWVKHSLKNEVPACAEISGDTIGDILLAIDYALGLQLTEEELYGGRSCFLEGAYFPAQDDYTRSMGIESTDLIIELGS